MRQKLNIYGNRGRNYDHEVVKVQNAKTSNKNKELIMRWHDHLFAKGSGPKRIAKLSGQIRALLNVFSGELSEATRKEIEPLIARINRLERSEATKADYRRCLKQFYTWYEEEDSRLEEGDAEARKLYKYLQKHVKIGYDIKEIDYSTILFEAEIRTVLEKGCWNSKQRAFIAALHEGGFRAQEILDMRIMDLQIGEDRIIVQVDGKTGIRRVPLVISMGYLLKWLDDHPHRDNNQAYLWPGDNPQHKHKPLLRDGAQQLIHRCFERAGFRKTEYVYWNDENGKRHQRLVIKENKKRCNLHWFRHSRATLNAPYMTEVMMCKFFGWVVGSKQVRRYVHADVRQVEDAVLRMRGLETKEEERQAAIKCPKCRMPNQPGTRYCGRCGMPLKATVMLEDEQKKTAAIDETFELMGEIMSNPELRERFEEFKKQHGGKRT